MTRADNRPDPIEDMLAALREDDPTYTDAELDAGFSALLTDLEQLTPERAREADGLATEAELGSDAYALGLEYLERGELERATRWLRIAASHGVSAAQQQLDDARELHRTVDSLSAKPVRPRLHFGERLAELLDCSSWLDTPDLSAASGLPAAASRLAEALDAQLRLAKARQEAERIVADARRAAAQIAADAQLAAQPDTEVTVPGHSRTSRVWSWSADLDYVPVARLAPLRCRDVDILLVTGTDTVALAEVKFSSNARWLRPHALQETPLSFKIGSFQLGSVQHSTVIAREQSHVQLAGSRHALLNLIGREATEAYEQAVQENNPSCLQCHFSADPQMVPRLVVWAQAASPGAAADAHKILADLVAPSTSGLLVPISVRDVAPPVPTTASERGDLVPGCP
ncbi:hypothetical protein ACFY8N_39470 [Streptomyces collinus]|uniref:hypothetical protein n=1 Tax=Streptomyces collinus TaxID=42684 RepID=UPI00369DF187